MIRYKSGYKYQLQQDYAIKIELFPAENIHLDHITLTTGGELRVNAGYCWDGASGPVPDTKANMRAALVHDALYQLMRHRELDRAYYKKRADTVFMILCIADGVPTFLAKSYYKGLQWFGKAATLPKNAKKIITAP